MSQSNNSILEERNFSLCREENGFLSLIDSINKTPIFYIDFLSGKLLHRFKYGGGKNQLIAKAVGIKKNYRPHVIDATAGFGEDGFVLAALGCKMDLIERSHIIYKLLQDGIDRAKRSTMFNHIEINLIESNSISYLKSLDHNKSEVIYLDPMFPKRTKSALVKKEMRILQSIVGCDIDSCELLEVAISIAKKRVVVKRPKLSNHLCDKSRT